MCTIILQFKGKNGAGLIYESKSEKLIGALAVIATGAVITVAIVVMNYAFTK